MEVCPGVEPLDAADVDVQLGIGPEVLDFLERVKARGPSRAPWRGAGSAVAQTPQERPKTIEPSEAEVLRRP
jgi:hypothetical protein